MLIKSKLVFIVGKGKYFPFAGQEQQCYFERQKYVRLNLPISFIFGFRTNSNNRLISIFYSYIVQRRDEK